MFILKITFKSVKKINNLKQKILKIKNLNQIKKIQIKNKTNIFTILKSPHVNKKSREHFIYKNYNQKIEINFINIYELINTLIIIKKKFSKNYIIQTKITKN